MNTVAKVIPPNPGAEWPAMFWQKTMSLDSLTLFWRSNSKVWGGVLAVFMFTSEALVKMFLRLR